MNKYKKILFLTLVISMFILTTRVSALSTIDIKIKPQFEVNDTISFNYTITSDKDEQISYFVAVSCPVIPTPLLELRTLNLIKNQPTTKEYVYAKVDENTEPQNCSVSVSITEPYRNTFSKNFSIITNPSFSFSIFTCKDQPCAEKSKIFIQKEDIFLNYYSGVENPSVTATLTYPDKSTRQISLPTSIKAEQIGTYTLKVTASKPVYKTTEKTIQFGVIENEAKITQLAITEEGQKEIPGEEKKVDYSLIIALSFVIIVIIGTIFAYKKLKSAKGTLFSF